MPDYSGLVSAMKQAGSEATEAKNPVKVCYGKVTSTTPIQINVDQKIPLGAAQLTLTRNVTDYEVNMMVDDEEQKITISNALQVGEEVILLREQGGQKYIVIDRVVNGV